MYRVLIADDEGIMLEALKNIITANFGNECELAFAKTGRAVVELAESFRPDIAFMDIQMPIMDGIETLKTIRTQENGVTVPVIFLTTKKDKLTVVEGAKLGIMDYIILMENSHGKLIVL